MNRTHIFLLITMPALLFAVIVIFSCRNERTLRPEESVKAIKAFDSDLTNLLAEADGQQAVQALRFLFNEPSSPLNGKSGLPGLIFGDATQDPRKWEGKYEWSADSARFVHSGEPGNIEVLFPPDSTGNPAILTVIEGFRCKPFFSRPCFPENFKLRISTDGHEILYAGYSADIQEEWPSMIKFTITGDGYKGSALIQRTREGDHGTMDIALDFNVRGKRIIDGTIFAEVGYTNQQIFIRTIEPEMTVFDIDISGMLDYRKVDPAGTDYIRSFNENCHIIFTEHGSGKEIGKFGIGSDKSGELLEWVLYLSDGSKASFYDYVLAFRKLMDYKYPNQR